MNKMATAFVKVRQVGGSLVATVPKEITESMNLHKNEIVRIDITRSKIDSFGALKGIGSFEKEDEFDVE